MAEQPATQMSLRQSHKFLNSPDGQVELVCWIDHHGSGGWQDKDRSPPRGMVCYSVGFIVAESDEAIRLVMSQGNDLESDTIDILKANIQARLRLSTSGLEVSNKLLSIYPDAVEDV